MLAAGLIVKSLVAVGTKAIIALCSETLIEWTFFYFAEAIAASTKTEKDDQWLKQFKAAYQAKQPKE